MEKLLQTKLYFLLTLILILSSCSEVVDETIIKGKVVDFKDNTPIGSVTIKTNPATTNLLTDNNGNFEIKDINEGEYEISASRIGFVSSTVKILVKEGQTVPVVIQIGDSTYFNKKPNTPQLISPKNNSSQNTEIVNLIWDCTDPENDNLTYDLFFGTTSDVKTLFASNLHSNQLVVENLKHDSIYYWKVVAKDKYNNSEPSEIFSFKYSNPNLILSMPFDGIIANVSTYPLTATPTSVTFVSDRNGHSNNAAYFNGTSKIVVSKDPCLDINQELTISLWARPDIGYGDPGNEWIQLIGRWKNLGYKESAYTVQINSNQAKPLVALNNTMKQNFMCFANTNILPEVWTHIALVYKEKTLSIYINGNLSNQIVSDPPQTSNYDLYIGRQDYALQYGNQTSYTGALDDIQIYKKALQPNEIKSLAK